MGIQLFSIKFLVGCIKGIRKIREWIGAKLRFVFNNVVWWNPIVSVLAPHLAMWTHLMLICFLASPPLPRRSEMQTSEGVIFSCCDKNLCQQGLQWVCAKSHLRPAQCSPLCFAVPVGKQFDVTLGRHQAWLEVSLRTVEMRTEGMRMSLRND